MHLCLSTCRNLSTKAEVLEELASQHGLPRIIIQHRKLTKICTSFLDPLVSKVVGLQKAQARAAKAAAQLGHSSAVKHSALVPAGPTADHVQMDPEAATELVRISGTFLQTNTSTGRLSMEEPSLQTIPRPLDYELAITPTSQNGATATGDGAQLMQQQQVNIRAAFVAPPGCVLLSADYGQIELRLMAHFSGDPHLLAALATPDDPFKELAARWRKCNVEQVTWADCSARWHKYGSNCSLASVSGLLDVSYASSGTGGNPAGVRKVAIRGCLHGSQRPTGH